MSKVFVLVSANLGHEKEVVSELKRIRGVSEAHFAYGAYDIIVKVEAPTQQEVKDVVFSKIRALDKVKSTVTLVVVE